MAYRDDIAALNPDHHWPLDGNLTDIIGAVTGNNVSMVFTGAALTEDASNSISSNAVSDRVWIPSTSDINTTAQTRKAVAGWFSIGSTQPPPKRIYGEGDNATTFQIIMAYGNNVMFECVEPGNFTLQVFGPVLQPDRVYHLCAIFEGNGFGNEVRFYVDGVEQTLAEPSNRQPNTADLNSRDIAEIGDATGNVGVGGDIVLLNGPVGGRWNHWATWDGADAVLTDAEVREELFEKGALPGVTIASGTQAAMQTALDALAASVRPDEALNVRVEAVTGDGDLTLTANNITHNPRASIHVQYRGTGTLTWVNENGSNASSGSTPNNGTIDFVTPAQLSVTPLIAGSEVRIYEAGTVTDVDGVETSGTSFVVNLTTPSVDVVVHALGYLYIKVKAVDLTNGDVTLPISQVVDRQYGNP